MAESIDGQKITSLRTRKTMYDQDSIIARLDTGQEFMIKTDDLLVIVSEFFWTPIKKIKHTYLTDGLLKEVSDG